MIPKTIESLVGKMSQIKLWLDEKRNQVSYEYEINFISVING